MRYTNTDVCYVYVLLDPRKPGKYKYSYWTFDYEPFYVGKGSHNRINSTIKYERYLGKSGIFKKKLISQKLYALAMQRYHIGYFVPTFRTKRPLRLNVN